MPSHAARPGAVALPVLATVLAAAWAVRGLADRAESADEPHRSTVRYFGRGGAREMEEALIQTGSSPREAASVTRVVSRRLGQGRSSFIIVASTAGAFHHVTAHQGRRRCVVGHGSPGVRREVVQEQQIRVDAQVRGTLLESLAASGVPPELALEFIDVFRWSIDPSDDPTEGDRFRVVWTERAAGDHVFGRRLEAVSYDGTTTGQHAGLRFDGDFFDKQGRSLRRPFLAAPVHYRAISSAFGGFRFSRLGRPMRRHRGIDYMAPTGTPIVCVADGKVAFSGSSPGYGQFVRVHHTGARETIYGHLSRFGPGIRPGAPVRQGQILGYVGATGNATGPHLHFELRRDGQTEDFREAKLPQEPLSTAPRPRRFRARWREMFPRQ